MENFNSFDLDPIILQSLGAIGFNAPTPIQAQTIPHALLGKDVLGSAQTGTGKTGAYAIPAVSYLIKENQGMVLILTPTRELAAQIHEAVRKILGKSDIYSALLIGGESISFQYRQLSKRPRLIVGTPGRINDHIDRGSLKLDKANFLVLDEVDRMLDMGFSIQLEDIAKRLPKKRQTLMFSATMAPEILSIAEGYLTDPVRISVGSTTTPIDKITQEIVHTSESDKYGILLTHLEDNTGSCVIFVKTKHGADKLALKLRQDSHKAAAIHGGLHQRRRDQVIQDFRQVKNRILVATDVAARGLDIPHIECVVNYDLPQCPEDYIHRIGRTGRAGAEGKAINLITGQDKLKWRSICRLINPGEKQDRSFEGGSASRQGRSGGYRGGYASSGRRSNRSPYKPTRTF